MYFYLCSLIFLILGSEAARKLPDQVAEHSATLLQQSETGKKIRECTCDEQAECVKEMKQQFDDCFDECWPLVSKDDSKTITNPESTKQCFTSKRGFITTMLDCLQNNLDTCLKEKEEKEVNYVDINVFLEKGEKKLEEEAALLFDTFGNEGKEVVDIAIKVGHCMRECFTKKNSGGFCYDKKGCQSFLESKKTGDILKKCMAEIGWEKHASEVCQCTVKSGVEAMDRWCAIIDTAESSKLPLPPME